MYMVVILIRDCDQRVALVVWPWKRGQVHRKNADVDEEESGKTHG